MAYTNSWSNIIPVGSDALSSADDAIRQARLDVDERMDTLTGNWSGADPVIVLGSIKRTIHWSKGVHGYGTTTVGIYTGIADTNNYRYVQPLAISTVVYWFMALDVLPPGATLTDAVARVYRDSGATIDFFVFEYDDTPAKTQLGTATSASTGYHDLSITGLSTVIDDEKSYAAFIGLTSDGSNANSARLVHVTVEYDLTYAFQGCGLANA